MSAVVVLALTLPVLIFALLLLPTERRYNPGMVGGPQPRRRAVGPFLADDIGV
jgi:hypothetical protein